MIGARVLPQLQLSHNSARRPPTSSQTTAYVSQPMGMLNAALGFTVLAVDHRDGFGDLMTPGPCRAASSTTGNTGIRSNRSFVGDVR